MAEIPPAPTALPSDRPVPPRAGWLAFGMVVCLVLFLLTVEALGRYPFGWRLAPFYRTFDDLPGFYMALLAIETILPVLLTLAWLFSSQSLLNALVLVYRRQELRGVVSALGTRSGPMPVFLVVILVLSPIVLLLTRRPDHLDSILDSASQP